MSKLKKAREDWWDKFDKMSPEEQDFELVESFKRLVVFLKSCGIRLHEELIEEWD